MHASQHLIGLTRAIGVPAALQVLAARAFGRREPMQVRLTGIPGAPSVRLRPKESDLFVASQIAGWQEYRLDGAYRQPLLALASAWAGAGETPVVVDAGANVGYSALYLAEQYPLATVVALEPDPATFAVLQANVQGHPRIVAVHAALWHDENGVSMNGGDSDSWSHRVGDAPGGDRVPSRTIGSLLSLLPRARLLVLKIDIEGAERQALAVDHALIRATPCLMIEPHDFMLPGHGSLSGLYEAVAGRETDTLLNGENLILLDSALIRAGAGAAAAAGLA